MEKINGSSNGAKKTSAKSANSSKSKSTNGNKSNGSLTKKTAADKNAEKRKALALASFQAAYESHQESLKK